MNPNMLPIILLGSVVGAIRRGEDGLAIGLCCAIAALCLVQYVLHEMDESRERKRREADAERRRHPNF